MALRRVVPPEFYRTTLEQIPLREILLMREILG
jgi:hypothetical protein